MLDLLVIGAGLAGLSAALTAADHGLRVRVVAKGLGAMHWSAGTIDLLGYLPGDQAAGAVEYPLGTLDRLPAEHPYRRLSSRQIRDSMAAFQTALASAGLSYQGESADRNQQLPSPVGAARPVWLAPSGQRGGNLDNPMPMLIVGFTGMRDFYPELIADNLRKQGQVARALQLPLSLLTDRHDSNTVQLAAAIDSPLVRKRLIAAIRRHTKRGERVGLPAILGLNEHSTVLQELSTELGVPVFEIPTLPPSVPGIRLYTTLQRMLTARGVRVEPGMEVVGFQADGATVRHVETETSARPLRHRAAHYLLATGGVLGGGFESDHRGRIWETVFDLPLSMPQDRKAWFKPIFLDPGGQPVFRGGVGANAAFQPVDRDGTVVFHNLRAAGAVLAGADGIQERSLEGIAIVTGVAAAESIVKECLQTA